MQPAPPTVEPYAHLIGNAFAAFEARFRAITRRARVRFARRDWHGMRADATERITLYREMVDQVEADLRDRLGDRVYDKSLWSDLRSEYSAEIAERADAELGETFFNSITRRIFDTVGVDPEIEFVTTDLDAPLRPPSTPVTRSFTGYAGTQSFVRAVLEAFDLGAPLANMRTDARRIAGFIDRSLGARSITMPITRVDLVRSVFYRGIGAYLVGRLFAGQTVVPLALAFHNSPDGVKADAVLLHEDDISILFSFARSYFHVDTTHPQALVEFLKAILPRKRRAELYISIGYNKHGKTELYRHLLRHFSHTDDQFVRARGKRGMVMTVFTMPSLPTISLCEPAASAAW
jgi:isocitrate dehydrogenase kinase/phosphatase